MNTKVDLSWRSPLALDVQHGYLHQNPRSPRKHHPQVILNDDRVSVLRTLREELAHAHKFFFSVAFVSPSAIALLKQELVEFDGRGEIVTSDYLGFNSPKAFSELLNLRQLGIDVRIHQAGAFHPKGYIFEHAEGVTAMIGSANLTGAALVQNHEWNLKVTAARESDLREQFDHLIASQREESSPLSQEWIDEYSRTYVAPKPRRHQPTPSVDDTRDDTAATTDAPDVDDAIAIGGDPTVGEAVEAAIADGVLLERSRARPPASPRKSQLITPNKMQEAALLSIRAIREANEARALVISATGSGKTILSALDVRDANPRRMLFLVHREQILDRTMQEYRRVLGGSPSDYGKVSGSSKQLDRRYTFATVQTLSQPHVLEDIQPDAFDYVVLDEAHRAGAPTHRRVIDYLEPTFLLGMTATPERTDGFNVFELFDYNVPYEIRLNHALEEDMLCPFHYYGIADVTFDDGVTTSEKTDLVRLISPERINHLIRALDIYGQAGVQPRGLIFCSRKDEAHALSEALNAQAFRGRNLRTLALTGDDSVSSREAAVARLEAGELDYVLTVDVFNEGVDIPSVNQVVMLRQTQSAIVFVQQLGRGLRKFDDKDYLVVIDVIGNYANNFLIPIALFGDESLNKESLRKNLIAAEEAGVVAGLSSVRFDKVSQARVLSSIVSTQLDAMHRLKAAITAMRNRVGGMPALADFLRFESTDPVVLATRNDHYPQLAAKVLKEPLTLSDREHLTLRLLSHEVLPAKRGHEFVLLRELFTAGSVTTARLAELLAAAGLPATPRHVGSTIDTLTLEQHSDIDKAKYGAPPVSRGPGGLVSLDDEVLASYLDTEVFRWAVDDLIRTGTRMVAERYEPTRPFVPGRQYSRKEVARLLCWPRKWTSTIYGYRTDTESGQCPVFVTLHKSDEITASTAYEDELLDPSTMRWYTRSNRTMQSKEVIPIVAGDVEVPVFVKKDDAEGTDFYYLGSSTARNAEETTIHNDAGKELPIVRMLLHFDEPIDTALYDYFHPVVTDG